MAKSSVFVSCHVFIAHVCYVYSQLNIAFDEYGINFLDTVSSSEWLFDCSFLGIFDVSHLLDSPSLSLSLPRSLPSSFALPNLFSVLGSTALVYPLHSQAEMYPVPTKAETQVFRVSLACE